MLRDLVRWGFVSNEMIFPLNISATAREPVNSYLEQWKEDPVEPGAAGSGRANAAGGSFFVLQILQTSELAHAYDHDRGRRRGC